VQSARFSRFQREIAVKSEIGADRGFCTSKVVVYVDYGL